MAKPQAVKLQNRASFAEINWRWLRKLANFVVLALCAVALGYGGRLLLTIELLPIRVVHVEGALQYPKQRALEQQLESMVDGGFLTIDLNVLKESAEALPWVQSADVSRSWPDSVRIHVTEQQIVARWGTTKFVNSDGDVFRNTEGVALANLPELNGPDGAGPMVLEKYRQFQSVAAGYDQRIVRMDRSLNNLLTVYTAAGLVLRLGHEQPVQRLRRFFETYAAGLIKQKNDIEYVDLRYSDGFSVMWKH